MYADINIDMVPGPFFNISEARIPVNAGPMHTELYD